MATGKSQFVGAAGPFYLAYDLALRGINAGLTLRNAPSADVLASSADGRFSLSSQVKTSRYAYRHNRYGHEGFEWHAGASAIGKHSESFFYAFIDLQEDNENWSPLVYFVPSRWVAEFVKPDFGRFVYFLPMTAKSLTCERWDLVKSYLAGEKAGLEWAKSWPKDKLVAWRSDF